MLANLLPGFRHTRTPLVAGALWLLIAWLLIGDAVLPDADGGVIESRLHGLTSLVGEQTVLAALALFAILLGGIVPSVPLRSIAERLDVTNGVRPQSTMCRLFGLKGDFLDRQGDFNLWLHRIIQRVPDNLGWEVFEDRKCPPFMRSWAQDAREHQVVRFGNRITARDAGVDGDAWHWLWNITEASIQQEMTTGLPMQLQIEREALYNDFDRVRAEAELRAAIVAPLIGLVILLAVGAGSLLWLLALVVPVWLLRHGVQAQIESDQRLQAAVQHGVITSPTIGFVRSLSSSRSSTVTDS